MEEVRVRVRVRVRVTDVRVTVPGSCKSPSVFSSPDKIVYLGFFKIRLSCRPYAI